MGVAFPVFEAIVNEPNVEEARVEETVSWEEPSKPRYAPGPLIANPDVEDDSPVLGFAPSVVTPAEVEVAIVPSEVIFCAAELSPLIEVTAAVKKVAVQPPNAPAAERVVGAWLAEQGLVAPP